MNTRRVYDLARARHSFEASLLEAHCAICGELAAHEVTEAGSCPTGPPASYLCCHHFSWILSDCGSHSSPVPAQRSTESPP